MNKSQIIALYDQDQRINVDYPGMRREFTPDVVRHIDTSDNQEGIITYSQLTEANVDHIIREKLLYFEKLGQGFEWIVHDYDQPPDLKERLRSYRFEVFFFIPVFIAAWLLGAGVIYFVSKALGGSGNFDMLLGSLGVGISISALFTLIPDLIQGILFFVGLIGQTEYLDITSTGLLSIVVITYLAGYTMTNIIFFRAGAHHVMGLSSSKSLFAGFLGFLSYFALIFTYTR